MSPTTNCPYVQRDDGRWQCPRCHDVTKPYAKAPKNNCRRLGWGDRLARWLGRHGITKQRYLQARGRHRVVGGMNCVLVEMPGDEPAQCGCDGRQAWLNWADTSARLLVSRLWS